MKKNIKKESKIKKEVVRFMVATMCVTSMAKAGAFPTLFNTPSSVVEASENGKSLKAPTNVVVTPKNPFSVTITFDKVSGANQYWIFVTDNSGETVKKIAATNKMTITKLKANSTYSYQVQAVYKKGKSTTTSNLSETVVYKNGKIPASEITSTQLVDRTDGKKNCLISYTPLSYMKSMYVYMSTDGSTYEKVSQNGAAAKSALVCGLEEGQTYYFKIRAYNKIDKKVIYSVYSEVVTVTISSSQPEEIGETSTTETPVTEVPTTEVPTTDVPVTDLPTVEQPTTEEPTTEEPVAQLTDEELIAQDGRPQAGNTYETHVMAYEVLELMNAERVRLGHNPCTMDPRYLQVAEIRAKEITILYSHQRPNGGNWYSTFKELGYKPGGAGENLVWGRKSAEGFYNAWKTSGGHYRNMTNKNYKYVGIYIYENPENGQLYAAMLLGTK